MSERIDDCWNRIGVRGAATCPELESHVHCRNCPAYAASAATVLNRLVQEEQPLAEYRGRGLPTTLAGTVVLLLFQIGEEWLGLDKDLVAEVATRRTPHSLPHQRNPAVLGLTNIRGHLTLTVSLACLLGLEHGQPAAAAQPGKFAERMLVASHRGRNVAIPVDQAYGMWRFAGSQLEPAPATLSHASASYVKAVADWRGKSVGVLDGELLFEALERSLA